MRENKGITLIALVITIIIMLILAGVTLNLALGDDGLIGYARNAKEATKRAEANDQAQIDQIVKQIDAEQEKQVTDENPGVLAETGTEEDPYLIESVEDLAQFTIEYND